MITVALLIAMQMPSYIGPSPARQRNERACDVSRLQLHQFISEAQSFITYHEVDSGGTLNTEEGVVLRAMVDNFSRPYLEEMSRLRDGTNNESVCATLAAAGEDEVVQKVVAPTFGKFYDYYYKDGRWKKAPTVTMKPIDGAAAR